MYKLIVLFYIKNCTRMSIKVSCREKKLNLKMRMVKYFLSDSYNLLSAYYGTDAILSTWHVSIYLNLTTAL